MPGHNKTISCEQALNQDPGALMQLLGDLGGHFGGESEGGEEGEDSVQISFTEDEMSAIQRV